MRPNPLLSAALATALVLPVATTHAEDGWSGTGELGLSAARGNARSENLNARLQFAKEDDQWRHRMSASGLRARGEVTADFDGDGIPETRLETTANRFQTAASSALKMNERASWISSVRYERDDFSTYAWQGTVSVGYGYKWIDTETTRVEASIGPGYRRASLAASGDVESEFIVRSTLEARRQLTETTLLVNELLVESGSDNTFVQNDFGFAVAINSSMALKLGLQARYNSTVEPGRKSTDTLSTMNLVYTFF